MTAQQLKQLLISTRFVDYDKFQATMDYGSEPEAFTKWLELQRDFRTFYLKLDSRRAELLLSLLIN